MRIVFWGSSSFSLPSLERLRKEHDLVGIVTNPDTRTGRGYKEVCMTPMRYCALENDLFCMQPCSMKDPEFVKALESTAADLFVVVSFGKIIPESLIYLPKHHTVNLHASILPKYRGASPIHHALLNGDTVTGNTVQFITKKLDEGDIILQSEVPVAGDDNYTTLSKKLADDGVELLMEAIRLVGEGANRRIPQNGADASYAPIIKKEDGLVSFVEMTAREIYNKWRAYIEWPGIFADFGNTPEQEKNRKVSSVSFTKIAINDKIYGNPGTVLQSGKGGLTVACKEGALDFLMLKPAGKKEIDFKSFINGYRPVTGNYF